MTSDAAEVEEHPYSFKSTEPLPVDMPFLGITNRAAIIAGDRGKIAFVFRDYYILRASRVAGAPERLIAKMVGLSQPRVHEILASPRDNALLTESYHFLVEAELAAKAYLIEHGVDRGLVTAAFSQYPWSRLGWPVPWKEEAP